MKTKTYQLQMNIGTAKYVVNFCTGKRFNLDGSLADDIRIFGNKKKANAYVWSELISQGYQSISAPLF